MSWFDEAVARRQRAQRAAASAKASAESGSFDPLVRQKQEVEAFDPLIQRLLYEYGEHVFGKSFVQKRFMIRLERPGKNNEKSWDWHWYLYSLVKNMDSLKMYPTFNAEGIMQGFVLMSGRKSLAIESTEESAIKEGLVSLYLQ